MIPEPIDRRGFLARGVGLAAGLAAWAAAAPRACAEPESGFRPSSHGFAFVNSFEGVPLPRSIREGQGLLARALRAGLKGELPSTFGLCGGMSLAAADYYHANIKPPADTKPPKQGTPLYEYLYQRQTDSLGENVVMAAKFLQWMTLPDAGEGSCEALSREELKGVPDRLMKGELVPLGLSLVRAKGNASSDAPEGLPWQNHQVLAYRWEAGPESGHFWIYDPNHPHDDSVRLVNLAAGSAVPARHGYELRWGDKRRPVRGVFLMPYEPKRPPKL